MKSYLILTVAAASLVFGVSQAGQGAANANAHAQGQGQAQGKGKAQDTYQGQDRDHVEDRDHDRDHAQDQDNHGQVTSECNHQANSRNLKGQERKQYVEWCQDRGANYKYDDKRWYSERSCYQKADDKGLSGDKRKQFLKNCFENHPEQWYSSDKARATK